MLLHEQSEEPVPFDVLLIRGLTPEEKELYCVTPNKIRKTKSLFYEYNKESEDQSPCVYTLSDCRPTYWKRGSNGLIYYDFRQLFLGVEDITEFRFIEKFLYDKTQWDKLQKSYEIAPYVEAWRNEQRLKVKSDMFSILLNDANNKQSKTNTQSAKYLLEKYYDPKTKNEVQSKKQKDKDNEILVSDHKRILESFSSKVN